MPKSIKSSRVGAIVPATALDISCNIGIDIISKLLRPRSIQSLELCIMRMNELHSRSDGVPCLLGYDAQVAFPADVRGVGYIISDIILAEIFGTLSIS